MKAYSIEPNFEMYQTYDDRTTKAIKIIAQIVFDSLRSGGDNFQYAVDWADPGEKPGGMFCEDIAEPHVIKFKDSNILMDRLLQSVDPNGNGGGDVRSIANCRSVNFGYDGQAFLCLRHEDAAPVSPDQDLVIVREISNFLVETDYFDGWMRDSTSD